MNKSKYKILSCVDFSYFAYYALFGAVSQFQKRYPRVASMWIKPAEETDQSNLPNLVNCDEFRRVLKQIVMKRLETIDWVLKQNFQNDIDCADEIDTVFCLDDRVSHSFRKSLYPGYKSGRAMIKRSFKVQEIKDYISNVIFNELELVKTHNIKMVKVPNAEGDDVIAMVMKKLTDYNLRVLFASDHDFCQIEGIRQFDLKGNEVKRIICDEELTPKEYLLHKIIVGDVSDCITQVFAGVGAKRALKLVKDKELLKERLKENQDAAKQFLLNKRLISFDEIPSELQDSITEKINEQIFSLRQERADDIDLGDFMTL